MIDVVLSISIVEISKFIAKPNMSLFGINLLRRKTYLSRVVNRKLWKIVKSLK